MQYNSNTILYDAKIFEDDYAKWKLEIQFQIAFKIFSGSKCISLAHVFLFSLIPLPTHWTNTY